jgi:hypothetical protein
MKKNAAAKAKVDRALLEPVLDANVALVRSLIASGADLNACISPVTRAFTGARAGTVGSTPLGIAIAERASESVFLDLTEHEEPDARKRENEARQRRAALLEIMEELARAGADVNLLSTFRLAKSPLLTAAYNNDPEAVELLLRYGARFQGSGALHAAAIEGNIEAVRALLTAGVDTNDMVNGITALQMLKQRAQSPKGESKWVWNFGPEYEQQEAEREKERVVRREQIMQILEVHQMTDSPQ